MQSKPSELRCYVIAAVVKIWKTVQAAQVLWLLYSMNDGASPTVMLVPMYFQRSLSIGPGCTIRTYGQWRVYRSIRIGSHGIVFKDDGHQTNEVRSATLQTMQVVRSNKGEFT